MPLKVCINCTFPGAVVLSRLSRSDSRQCRTGVDVDTVRSVTGGGRRDDRHGIRCVFHGVQMRLKPRVALTLQAIHLTGLVEPTYAKALAQRRRFTTVRPIFSAAIDTVALILRENATFTCRARRFLVRSVRTR